MILTIDKEKNVKDLKLLIESEFYYLYPQT